MRNNRSQSDRNATTGRRKSRHEYLHHPPFWQTDRPYPHEHHISDARFHRLGYIMALLAGAINTSDFSAFARYTSHVTGSVSLLVDTLCLHQRTTAAAALVSAFCFVAGAAHSGWVILWTQQKRLRGSSGFSMWLEALYLLVFGLFGIMALQWDFGKADVIIPSLVLFLLCFIMGMHNTVITLLPGGAIRSTHTTGLAADLGIEISCVLHYSRAHHPHLSHVHVNKLKMRPLSGLMWAFLPGGVIGAWGYHKIGHHFALPVAAVLFILGAGSVGHDVKLRLRFALVRWYQRKQALERHTDGKNGS